ncbi:MAG: PfkB family carbohydrate kinase [Chloroflexota bacterium]
MILTLTPNAALDRVLVIDEFRPETTMRPNRIIDKVGGKALDASVALRVFGVEVLALSFVAGETGRRLVALLDEYGIRHDLIWLEGESRLSHVIVETRHRRHSHIIAGALPVPAAAAAEFLRKYRTHVSSAAWVIAGGSLPPGAPADYYGTIIEIANQAGAPILIDATGPPVQAALPTPPTILKMNWDEFTQTFGASPAGALDRLAEQARAVAERYRLPALVLTCGKQGLLACTPEGEFLATAPPQPAVNAAGAGDTVSAALAWRLSIGDGWPATLRWAAAGAASVLTAGTADCRPADLERILPQTTVQRL